MYWHSVVAQFRIYWMRLVIHGVSASYSNREKERKNKWELTVKHGILGCQMFSVTTIIYCALSQRLCHWTWRTTLIIKAVFPVWRQGLTDDRKSIIMAYWVSVCFFLLYPMRQHGSYYYYIYSCIQPQWLHPIIVLYFWIIKHLKYPKINTAISARGFAISRMQVPPACITN